MWALMGPPGQVLGFRKLSVRQFGPISHVSGPEMARAPSLVPGILLSLAPGILTGCVGWRLGGVGGQVVEKNWLWDGLGDPWEIPGKPLGDPLKPFSRLQYECLTPSCQIQPGGPVAKSSSTGFRIQRRDPSFQIQPGGSVAKSR